MVAPQSPQSHLLGDSSTFYVGPGREGSHSVRGRNGKLGSRGSENPFLCSRRETVQLLARFADGDAIRLPLVRVLIGLPLCSVRRHIASFAMVCPFLGLRHRSCDSCPLSLESTVPYASHARASGHFFGLSLAVAGDLTRPQSYGRLRLNGADHPREDGRRRLLRCICLVSGSPRQVFTQQLLGTCHGVGEVVVARQQQVDVVEVLPAGKQWARLLRGLT